ncbi:MAG TPA: hypothetical protein VEZ20_03525 [Allosphingosinicella sp.]|nr:hypothetical protein [Allosphingosinicella sp.]
MTSDEARVLQSEVLALQAVLMAVFRRLVRDRPDLDGLFRKAFDEAETILAGVATRDGLEDALGTTTGALQIIDELRNAVLRDADRSAAVPPG